MHKFKSGTAGLAVAFALSLGALSSVSAGTRAVSATAPTPPVGLPCWFAIPDFKGLINLQTLASVRIIKLGPAPGDAVDVYFETHSRSTVWSHSTTLKQAEKILVDVQEATAKCR